VLFVLGAALHAAPSVAADPGAAEAAA
jgi:hypothetical protein